MRVGRVSVATDKSDEPSQMGDPGGRGRTPPIYYEPTKHTAEVEQATRLRNAHQGGGAVSGPESLPRASLSSASLEVLSSWLPAVPTPFPFEAMRSSVVVGVVVSVVVGVVVSVMVGIVVNIVVGIVVGVMVGVLRSSR